MMELGELLQLWKEQRENYLTQLYQNVVDTPDADKVNEIMVISGKMQGLEDFANTAKQFIENKINKEVS